ncbi:MAG: hypothetical protein KatS3mg083_636 [Candidatus Dojkabacteria bacterium]|nr:MAG: hypothetical protein KatS3mg083_636 [Candidatus Dojkabacteria bacterium]
MKSIMKHLIRIASGTITVGILSWWLLSAWREISKLNFEPRWGFLCVSFIVYSLSFLLTVIVWIDILKSLGITDNWTTHIKSLSYSALGRRLPGTIWYVGIRSKIYGSKANFQTIVAASTIEMAVIVISSLPCSAFILLNYHVIAGRNSIPNYLLGLLPLVLSIIILNQKVLSFLLKKLGVKEIHLSNKKILKWVVLYCIEWIFVGLLLFSITNIFTSVSVSNILFFIGCVAFTGLLSRALLFLPSNFGFTELTIGSLLSLVIIPFWAPVIAISNRAIIVTFELIWGFGIYLFERIAPKKYSTPFGLL